MNTSKCTAKIVCKFENNQSQFSCSRYGRGICLIWKQKEVGVRYELIEGRCLANEIDMRKEEVKTAKQ